MIEVTDEMRYAIKSWFSQTNLSDESISNTVIRIIELHEQSKPKPEPVAFISFKHGGWLVKPHEAERMKNIDAEFRPLYTTPPTREPLSEEQRTQIKRKLYGIEVGFDFDEVVDAIEQAHGIGCEQ